MIVSVPHLSNKKWFRENCLDIVRSRYVKAGLLGNDIEEKDSGENSHYVYLKNPHSGEFTISFLKNKITGGTYIGYGDHFEIAYNEETKARIEHALIQFVDRVLDPNY
jgi:hypothetical protein